MTQNDDCPFSMVAACRMTGQSPQEAFNTVGNLLEERYQYWQKAIEQLPSWGAEIDANVARYIQGIQNVVQANITWRYEIAAESETKLNKCSHATASDRGDILGNKLPRSDGHERLM